MGTFWQDVRYGARMLWKRPGFTAVGVLALALGVGANTAIFSVVNGVLLKPLPFPGAERVVSVTTGNVERGTRGHPAAYPDFVDWQAQTSSFEAMAAYSGASAALTGDGGPPEQIGGLATTPDMFKAVGVAPARGSVFTAEEAQRVSRAGEGGEGEDGQRAAQVVVISHGLWQRRFGSDPGVVGRSVMLDNAPATILGVMPEGFRFPLDFDAVDFWVPLDTENPYMKHRGASFLGVVARLREGVTTEQAQADISAVAARMRETYPDSNRTRGAFVASMHETLVGDVRPALLVLLTAVGFVLLIACANVANLTLARATSRSREFAVRTALGAGRWRIVRQLLTESLLLALAGGAAGLLLTLWGTDLLVAAVPQDIPRMGAVETDLTVLAFTLGVSVLTGLLFGLAPAIQASRADLSEALKEGGRAGTDGAGRGRLRSALVVSEVALSLVLLAGAGLLIKSFWHLREVNPGFNPEGVLTASMILSDNKYETDEQQGQFIDRALERLRAVPGVESVGLISPLPMTGDNINTNFTIDNRSFEQTENVHRGERKIISPDLLRALGVPVLRGRSFTERDAAGAPTVFIVNETLARRFFPGQEAVGRVLSARDLGGIKTGEIVGVVADVKIERVSEEPTPAYYMSSLQKSNAEVSVVARARPGLDPASLAPGLRAAVQEVDPDQPLGDVRTMKTLLADSMARERFSMTLLAVFAGVALVLAAVGIFGVMSYAVTQRTHEIGIRMALGAQGRDVLRLILRRGMALTLAGVCLGVAAALALTRLMGTMLYGVSASDPATFAGVTALLVAVALAACLIPARRATKVDPMEALRYE
jgi:putative ABC transport system permease protein